MKKIMVIAASLFMISCGGSSNAPVSVDSIVTPVDSTNATFDTVSTDSVITDSLADAIQGGGFIEGSEKSESTINESLVK